MSPLPKKGSRGGFANKLRVSVSLSLVSVVFPQPVSTLSPIFRGYAQVTLN